MFHLHDSESVLVTGPVVAQRVGRGIALLFHDRGTRRRVRGQRHAPAALYSRERPGTNCAGSWVGPRAGLYRCGKFRPPPGFDPRTVEPVAQSLYRLSYRAQHLHDSGRLKLSKIIYCLLHVSTFMKNHYQTIKKIHKEKQLSTVH